VTVQFIAAGKPMQNAYIESFNGKFHDECLNEHWFINVPHARAIIERWRQDYNTERPYSSLQYQTPAAFAARCLASPHGGCSREHTTDSSQPDSS
jgi:putative transposase